MTCSCGGTATLEREATEPTGRLLLVPDEHEVGVSPPQTAVWNGPIGIEGQKTGDGRDIKVEAVRWDTLPVPLRWAEQDYGEHDGAVVVGNITDVERLSVDEANARLAEMDCPAFEPKDPDKVRVLWGTGTFDLGGSNGKEAHRQVKERWTRGISMDLDDIVLQEGEEQDEYSINEGRMRAATIVAIPAFEGAKIAVADPVALARKTVEEMFAAEVFNWVEEVGGLPPYIKRIVKHLQEKGMAESHAIATAVNVVKKMCATGDLNFPGAQQANAGSRAEACAAVADWEAKKARSHASSADSSFMEAFENDLRRTQEPGSPLHPDTMAASAFSFNPKQARVPRGNGRLSGRWVDTPSGIAGSLQDLMGGVDSNWNRQSRSASLTAALAKPLSPEDVEAFRGSSAEKWLETKDGVTTFTKERQELHAKMIEDALSTGEPGFHTFSFMGGGPATGKSSMEGARPDISERKAVVNADLFKENLPEYHTKDAAGGDVYNAATVHEESSYLTKAALAEGFGRGIGMTLDGTGDNSADGVRKKIKQAREAGYDVNGFYTTLDPDIAWSRALARAERTGRYVPEGIVRGTNKSVSKIFEDIVDEFDELVLYDTDVPKGAPPILIGTKEKGKPFQVVDQALYDAFLARGKG